MNYKYINCYEDNYMDGYENDYLHWCPNPRGSVFTEVIKDVNDDNYVLESDDVVTRDDLNLLAFYFVEPASPPNEVLEFIRKLPVDIRSRMVPAYRGYNSGIVVVDRFSGAPLHSRISSEEGAEIYFDDVNNIWREGKPWASEYYSYYMAGDMEIEVPDNFDPEKDI